MILADKIIENRKKNGWSQEELAQRLGVSRQSISKWEGSQAIPDMNKILQMSQLFGVTTDYLLKDEIETSIESDTVLDVEENETIKQISMEEANQFLDYNEKSANLISTGVLLCILSVIPFFVCGVLAEMELFSINERVLQLAGMILMLVMIALAVALFVMMGLQGNRYLYLKDQTIDTEYGVTGLARDKKNQYAPIHSRNLILGISLCILASVPLLLLYMMRYHNNTDFLPLIGISCLFLMLGVGVKLIVQTCIKQCGFDKLLEEGNYERSYKKISHYIDIYWAIVLVIYLIWSFVTQEWRMTWIIWAIGGILQQSFIHLLKAFIK